MKLASIEKIVEVFPHPNADTLEFVKVLNFNCIVLIGKFKVGDWCIFIQPDSILPEASWTAFYKKMSPSRVRAVKLRDFYSYGIVETFDILSEYPTISGPDVFCEGQDITDELGILKYEAPQPQEPGSIGSLPIGIARSDEENALNLELQKYYGKLVDITLKVDGKNINFYYKDGKTGACGRRDEYDLSFNNDISRMYQKYDIQNKLSGYCEKYGLNISLKGELYGKKIQAAGHNPHALLPVGVMFFACWDIQNMRYFGPSEEHYYVNVCKELNLPVVPMIEKSVIFAPEIISKYQNLPKLDGKSFEGVVVKGDRFSFKIMNFLYDSKK